MIVQAPLYFLHALAEIGVREVAGDGHNENILKYWDEAQVPRGAGGGGDETPWCAAFVGAMLMRGGAQPTGKGSAKSYQLWGKEARGINLLGAVVVLDRPDPAPKWQGHVGFCCGFTAGTVNVLGGNQSDRVSIATFPRSRVVAMRYPSSWDMKQFDKVIMLRATQIDPRDR